MITPDHTIRTKNWPLVLPAPEDRRARRLRTRDARAGKPIRRALSGYFERNNKRVGGSKHELDPLPRVVLVPGLGLFGLGRTKRDAAIAADIAEAWIEGVSDAEAIGRFESISEADMFDCEYWPLEQAKLGARARELPLAGQIAAVTGAGGAIGAATRQDLRGGGRRGCAARREFCRRRRASRQASAAAPCRSPAT